MASDKKDLERHFLDRFLALLNPSIHGPVEPGEKPDFVVVTEAGRVGIEITELHHVHSGSGRPLQASQAMRERVVARAKKIYDAAGHPPVHVAAMFNDHRPVEKGRVEQLAEAIVGVALRNLPGTGETRSEEFDWVNRAYFPEDFHRISVHNVPNASRSFFSAPGATWVGEITSADVQRVLDAKEPKVADYRTRCDSVWLLINSDTTSMSTWFEFDSTSLSSSFRSSFDRVFLLRHFVGKLQELKVVR